MRLLSEEERVHANDNTPLCLAIVRWAKEKMYVPSGTPREMYILPMAKQELYEDFRSKYVDVIRLCEGQFGPEDQSAFAQRARAVFGSKDEFDVAKLAVETRRSDAPTNAFSIFTV